MSLDPNKTYLVWNGTEFPNSTNAQFKAPAGSTIDWGDGTVETFDTASTTVNTHTYTDGKTEHTIAISGLTSIDILAFRNCHRLKSVAIGNSVTSIGERAFSNCSGLTSVTIGNSVKSTGVSAFRSCGSLTSVTIGSSVTSIDEDTFAYCGSLMSVVIPDSVTSIGKEAFYYCGDLTSVTIPDSVTSIGDWAFNNCSSLTSVTIPDSVTSIGVRAFYECSGLKSVTIGNSVTSIGSATFYGCSSLKQLILFRSTPPTLSSDAAIPTTVQSIYVQQSSKAAYQAAANWTTFASKIVSDNIYLSFVRFNQKNKEYINSRLTLSDIYPVGSIYLSVNSTSPATLFGGVWERIQDRFLLAAGDTYSAGGTGGEATHTLTINEMPKHSHDIIADGNGKFVGYNDGNIGNYVRNDYNDTGNIGNQYTTDKVGGNQAHNNMPPYLAVYMWKRIS